EKGDRVPKRVFLCEPLLDALHDMVAGHGRRPVSPEAHELGIIEPIVDKFEVGSIDRAEVDELAGNHEAETEIAKTDRQARSGRFLALSDSTGRNDPQSGRAANLWGSIMD